MHDPRSGDPAFCLTIQSGARPGRWQARPGPAWSRPSGPPIIFSAWTARPGNRRLHPPPPRERGTRGDLLTSLKIPHPNGPPARAVALVAGRSARCFCPAPPGRALHPPPRDTRTQTARPPLRPPCAVDEPPRPPGPPRHRAVCSRLSREPSCASARPVPPSAVARPLFTSKSPRTCRVGMVRPAQVRRPSPCPRRPRLRVQSDTKSPPPPKSPPACRRAAKPDNPPLGGRCNRA